MIRWPNKWTPTWYSNSSFTMHYNTVSQVLALFTLFATATAVYVPPPPCQDILTSCISYAQCCSGSCLAGFCAPAPLWSLTVLVYAPLKIFSAECTRMRYMMLKCTIGFGWFCEFASDENLILLLVIVDMQWANNNQRLTLTSQNSPRSHNLPFLWWCRFGGEPVECFANCSVT